MTNNCDHVWEVAAVFDPPPATCVKCGKVEEIECKHEEQELIWNAGVRVEDSKFSWGI